ncbi:hypothetical protein DSECCO2_628790 [anaerobic digester metagenome]
MRVVACLLGEEGIAERQCTVHFIGGNVVEEVRGGGLPHLAGCFQQVEGAHDVGPGEGKGIGDGTVHVTFGRQVDDAVDPVLFKHAPHLVGVADIGFDEPVVGLLLNIVQVGQVAGVGELVEVHDAVVGIAGHHQPHHM